MLPHRGCGINLGLVYAASPRLSRYSRGLSEPREIDALFVIPADAVNYLNELLNGCSLPVPRIEQLRFQPPEESLTGRIVGRTPFTRPVLQGGAVWGEALQERIKHQIRSKASARHVPNEVVQVAEIPRTLSGKKMEVPVRKLLLGASPDKAASLDSMQNPDSLAFFVQYAKALKDRLHA